MIRINLATSRPISSGGGGGGSAEGGGEIVVTEQVRKDALVKFAHVCGILCGTGGTLRLHNAGGHWAIVKRCDEWVS